MIVDTCSSVCVCMCVCFGGVGGKWLGNGDRLTNIYIFFLHYIWMAFNNPIGVVQWLVTGNLRLELGQYSDW